MRSSPPRGQKTAATATIWPGKPRSDTPMRASSGTSRIVLSISSPPCRMPFCRGESPTASGCGGRQGSWPLFASSSPTTFIGKPQDEQKRTWFVSCLWPHCGQNIATLLSSLIPTRVCYDYPTCEVLTQLQSSALWVHSFLSLKQVRLTAEAQRTQSGRCGLRLEILNFEF